MTCDFAREQAAAFVLGALDPSEERAVRDHLASCREPHPEYTELGSVVPALAASVELVTPPASLKARVMAAAAADLATRRPGAAPVVPFPSAEERARRTSRGSWILRIAAVLAIVALGASNAYLLLRPTPADPFAVAVERVLEVARQTGSSTAVLTGEEGGPRGIAAVAADGSVVMAMQNLGPTSGTEVYETWVIAPGADPVPIGGFQVGADGVALATMTGTPAASGVTLALTREAAPGATTPTLPIVSSGPALSPPPADAEA
ncbi:MAG TPA: anti-sigma factor [Candidatus Limnocylindrales bacterium]